MRTGLYVDRWVVPTPTVVQNGREGTGFWGQVREGGADKERGD